MVVFMSEIVLFDQNVLYCERDQLYIGFGADRELSPPPEHDDDDDWLTNHCWICYRSRKEIAHEQLA